MMTTLKWPCCFSPMRTPQVHGIRGRSKVAAGCAFPTLSWTPLIVGERVDLLDWKISYIAISDVDLLERRHRCAFINASPVDRKCFSRVRWVDLGAAINADRITVTRNRWRTTKGQCAFQRRIVLWPRRVVFIYHGNIRTQSYEWNVTKVGLRRGRTRSQLLLFSVDRDDSQSSCLIPNTTQQIHKQILSWMTLGQNVFQQAM